MYIYVNMSNSSTFGLSDTQGLIGNPLTWFQSLPADVQWWTVWGITGLAFLFLITTVVSFLGHGIGSNVKSMDRDAAGRKHHLTGIATGIITVVLVIVAVALAIGILT